MSRAFEIIIESVNTADSSIGFFEAIGLETGNPSNS
jgi:hypothetical protein